MNEITKVPMQNFCTMEHIRKSVRWSVVPDAPLLMFSWIRWWERQWFQRGRRLMIPHSSWSWGLQVENKGHEGSNKGLRQVILGFGEKIYLLGRLRMIWKQKFKGHFWWNWQFVVCGISSFDHLGLLPREELWPINSTRPMKWTKMIGNYHYQ